MEINEQQRQHGNQWQPNLLVLRRPIKGVSLQETSSTTLSQSEFSIRIDPETPKSRRDTLNLTSYLGSVFPTIPLVAPIAVSNSSTITGSTIVTLLTTTIPLTPIYFLDSP